MRIKTIDYTKFMAVVMVVLGHCLAFGNGKDYYVSNMQTDNILHNYIYSFHMPLFMLISGYLFAFSCKKKTTKELLVSKFKQLIVPLFCWSFVSLVIQMVKIAIGISSQKITLIWIFQTIYSGFWGGPWFLWALWWCSFIVIVGKKLFKDNLIFFVLVCLICFVRLLNQFDVGCFRL